ncbi:hypothetical protein ACE1TI_17970 [Alteribacillus sp. JSM 102045]|uniref:hypothetical protein n=1 Tax=Alteribacillus sp. JSM 102045 TaxID=1562101 RepID=UPI0035C0C695
MMSTLLSKQLETYLEGKKLCSQTFEDIHYIDYEIEGGNYNIYVHFDKQNEIFITHTLHQERYEVSKYRMDHSKALETAKANERTYKTLKGVVNYIERYVS